MKAMLTLLLTVFVTLSYAGPDPKPAKKTIKVNESSVGWKGYKVTGQHEGTIKVKQGSLDFEGDVLKGGTVIIDMNSINCTDLSGGTADKLVGHLKSEDFFGSAKYPTAKFEITKVVSRGTPGEYKVIGNITIKETTKEIKFLASVKDGMATANIKIDRSEFDVRYGSGSFIDNLGDSTIYDEFDVTLKLAY